MDMLITVPAYQFLFSSNDKFFHHYRRYNYNAIEKLLKIKKIEIQKITYFNSFLFIPLALIIIFTKLFDLTFIKFSQKPPNFFLNKILKKIFLLEKYILLRGRFYFGLSLLAIIKKIN